MTEETKYTGIVEQIKTLDDEISQWSRHYASLRQQLDDADQMVMALHKKKWKLELLLVPVQTVPTFRPRKAKPINPELEVIDIDKLSQAQIAGLMALLRSQTPTLEIDEENEDDNDKDLS